MLAHLNDQGGDVVAGPVRGFAPRCTVSNLVQGRIGTVGGKLLDPVRVENGFAIKSRAFSDQKSLKPAGVKQQQVARLETMRDDLEALVLKGAEQPADTANLARRLTGSNEDRVGYPTAGPAYFVRGLVENGIQGGDKMALPQVGGENARGALYNAW